MKVFLLSNVSGCGLKGEVKDVSNGYAANFLIPRGLAVAVNDVNQGDIKGRLRNIKDRFDKNKKNLQEFADKISDLKLTFSMRVKENGTDLYGSISSSAILDELDKKGFKLEKNNLILSSQIKTVGKHSVPVRMSSDISADLVVNVVEA